MRCLSFYVLFCAIIATAPQAETRILRLSAAHTTPYFDPDVPNGGTALHFIRQMIEHIGAEVDVTFVPRKRALEEARNGSFQLTAAWPLRTSNFGYFIYVGPVIQERQVLFVRSDSPLQDWSDFDDLRGLRIGVVSGFTYTQDLMSLATLGSLDLHEAPSDLTNLRKLYAGRIDVFAVTDVAGWHLIRTEFPEDAQAQFRELPTPLSENDSYLLVPRALPDAKDLAFALQTAANELMARPGN